MAASLLDYAHIEFPGHEVATWKGVGDELRLRTHSVVAHLADPDDAQLLIDVAEHTVGDDRVGAVLVRGHEALDPVDAIAADRASGDVGRRHHRLSIAILAGALVGVVGGILVTAAAGFDLPPALAVSALLAVVGGAIGAVSLDLEPARRDRMTLPPAPGTDIVVVAAFVDEEALAAEVTRRFTEARTDCELRIVGIDARWHVPRPVDDDEAGGLDH